MALSFFQFFFPNRKAIPIYLAAKQNRRKTSSIFAYVSLVLVPCLFTGGGFSLPGVDWMLTGGRGVCGESADPSQLVLAQS